MSVNVLRGVFGVSLLLALAGCNAGGSGLDFGLGGSQAQPQAQQQQQQVAAVVQGICPNINLRDGTAFYRTYARGGDNDPEKVVYQASLADTTRACVRTASDITITAMVKGRLVAGPAGKAGTINLPIRVTVTDPSGEVYSELTQYPVTLADVNQPTQFIFSKPVTIPGNVTGLTRVLIGFDEGKKR